MKVQRYASMSGIMAMVETGPYVAIEDYEEQSSACQEMREVLEQCADHFKLLRENGVYVYPNHPENPEAKIKALLAKLPEVKK